MDDHERFADGYSKGKFAPANPAVTPEDEAVGADTRDWLYREADKTVKRGHEILYLSMEEGLSAHQIADRTGIAKSTVVDRLNKLLDFIREHREDLL
jgi:DNA-directed RNA polymerase specialized sigma24 family protein